MTFLADNPTQLELPISSELSQRCWLQSQAQPTAKGQWNEYLNQICYQTFLPWLQTEYQLPANVLLDEILLPSLWSVVNGTTLIWGKKRLILIPEKTFDNSEYEIPQEWVDIPKLAGDYYLAVQINPDELSMRVWGYTTHKQIKTSATYHSSNRTYTLDAIEMIPDLNVLWVVSQLNPNEETQAALPSLPTVSATQAENLLSRLANTTIIQPRLEIPFLLWGELVSHDIWRQRLYQLRQGESQNNISLNQVAINLSQWLQNTFEDTWQSVDSLFSSSAFSFRGTETENSATIIRAKTINLPNNEAYLLVGLDAEADGRISIRIQLRSRSQDEYLPAETNLKLLSASGQIIQSIQARSQDNIIQLKKFKSPSGTQFTVQIQIEDFIVSEDFLI